MALCSSWSSLGRRNQKKIIEVPNLKKCFGSWMSLCEIDSIKFLPITSFIILDSEVVIVLQSDVSPSADRLPCFCYSRLIFKGVQPLSFSPS